MVAVAGGRESATAAGKRGTATAPVRVLGRRETAGVAGRTQTAVVTIPEDSSSVKSIWLRLQPQSYLVAGEREPATIAVTVQKKR